MIRIGKAILVIGLLGFATVGLYVLSILWRVSWNEQILFGRSTLIPLSFHPKEYTDPPSASSYCGYTYKIEINGKTFHVQKQTINGFQHAFGSALVAYEIGELPADYLFRLNEYLEAYTCKDGQTYEHFLDTKKDLFNNSIGRNVGHAARTQGLQGQTAEVYMIKEIIDAMHSDSVISHYYDPEVLTLPTLEQYGCPGLPHANE